LASEGKDWRNVRADGLHDRVKALVQSYARRAEMIDLIVIVISCVTSGALWALVADLLPRSLGYAGAALSTLVTILSFYTYSSGLARKRGSALGLLDDVNLFLADLRSNPAMSDQDYWASYKGIENRYNRLQFGSAAP
jgi:hypothetical protein